MTPVTPVPAMNDTNNNTSFKEELVWSKTDNDEDDHVLHMSSSPSLGSNLRMSNLDDWMKYHQYSSLQDIISEYFSSSHDLCLHMNYKNYGMTTALPQLVVT